MTATEAPRTAGYVLTPNLPSIGATRPLRITYRPSEWEAPRTFVGTLTGVGILPERGDWNRGRGIPALTFATADAGPLTIPWESIAAVGLED